MNCLFAEWTDVRHGRRLELFEKLEKAEGRIVALEKQVKHSAALLHFLEMWRFALSDMS